MENQKELPTGKKCSACKGEIIEVFQITSGGGGGGRIGGSHPFWISSESIGHECSDCMIMYRYPRTTDEEKLRTIAFEILANQSLRYLSEDYTTSNGVSFNKGQKVFVVPKLSGTTSSLIYSDFGRTDTESVMLEPKFGSPIYSIPKAILAKEL